MEDWFIQLQMLGYIAEEKVSAIIKGLFQKNLSFFPFTFKDKNASQIQKTVKVINWVPKSDSCISQMEEQVFIHIPIHHHPRPF